MLRSSIAAAVDRGGAGLPLGFRPNFAPEGAKVTSDRLGRLAELVRNANGRLVCLTGAGLSTESGVPDYRSPKGSYSKGHRPMRHQEFVRDPASRARYWARSLVGWRFFDAAQPNDAHRALVALEHGRHLSGVVTQNVDGLHQRAGAETTVELHGRNDEVQCLGCGRKKPRAAFQEELQHTNRAWVAKHLLQDASVDVRADGDAHLSVQDFATFAVPACSVCGGTWMPRVVFFGGALVPEVKHAAQLLVDEAEALLVLGSSCKVFSAFGLVKAAADAGKPVALINIGETRVDALVPAHLRLPWRCGEALTALCKELGLSARVGGA